MWNINYQGILYGEDRIRANFTMIWAMVMTTYPNIYLPQADWDQLVKEWSPIGEIKYSKVLVFYYFEGLDCSEVRPQLKDIAIVITRDRYVLPPEAWTYDIINKKCYLWIAPLPLS